MLPRIKRIIAREQLKFPEKQGMVLLFGRIGHVLKARLTEKLMAVRKDSTFLSSEDIAMCSLLPKKVLDLIITELRPTTVLDIGCGTGAALEYFAQCAIESVGIENSKVAILKSKVSSSIVRFNLKQELCLGKRFDLVWCFEVIEHIHPRFEGNFLKTLTNHSDTIVLSAAQPGQGGRGHFNEQPPEYWVQKFRAMDYRLDTTFTDKLRSTGEIFAENLLCFRKAV